MADSLQVTLLNFPSPNPHKTASPCLMESHIWKKGYTKTLTEFILYCTVCGWTYPEVVADTQKCSVPDCPNDRWGGTDKCFVHNEKETILNNRMKE